MRDLPGFYFDPQKNRYFPLSANRNDAKPRPEPSIKQEILIARLGGFALWQLRFRQLADRITFKTLKFPQALNPVGVGFQNVPGVDYLIEDSSDGYKFAYSTDGQKHILFSSLTDLVLAPQTDPLSSVRNITACAYSTQLSTHQDITCRGQVAYEPIQQYRSDMFAIVQAGKKDTLVHCPSGEVLAEFGPVTCFKIINNVRLVGLVGGGVFMQAGDGRQKSLKIPSAVFAFFPHPLPDHFMLLTMHGDFFVFSWDSCVQAFSLKDFPIDHGNALDFVGGLEPISKLFVCAFKKGKQVLILDPLHSACVKIVPVDEPIAQVIVLPSLVLMRV